MGHTSGPMCRLGSSHKVKRWRKPGDLNGPVSGVGPHWIPPRRASLKKGDKLNMRVARRALLAPADQDFAYLDQCLPNASEPTRRHPLLQNPRWYPSPRVALPSSLGPHPRKQRGELSYRSDRASQDGGCAPHPCTFRGVALSQEPRGEGGRRVGTHRSIRSCHTWDTWRPWSVRSVGPRPPPALVSVPPPAPAPPAPGRRLAPRPGRGLWSPPPRRQQLGALQAGRTCQGRKGPA
ncbi:uncharacterized protein LOC110307069 [Mus caroli]|uniref:Uncharacterized protein LOC110307069 n=1 Tax=Mus caroli TaxID=10089 RepID=A0A6P7RI04_MUSCR|nr:uncharacterized protein LOC110307069 [Mus caroli]XP_029340338.1 uncharacterized protein LOC110307069 [Mus caroli]